MVDSSRARGSESRSLTALGFASNAFLIAFALDASISVLDNLLQLAHLNPLGSVRQAVAELVVLSAAAMGIALVFVPRLPKRVLLAPVIFALWCAIGAPPFSVNYAGWSFDLALSLMQLALAAIAFGTIYLRGRHWLLEATDLPPKNRMALRIASNLAAALVGLFLAAIVLTVTSFAAFIDKSTDGYIQFGPGIVEAKESVLTKGGKTVRLVGMVHIAEPQFYGALIDSLPAHSLVLAEGVSDQKGLLTSRLSYGNAARAMGLAQQPNLSTALKEHRAAEPAKAADDPPMIEGADVDISTFTPTTTRFLSEIATIYASKSFAEGLARYGQIESKYTLDDYKTIWGDILDKRNRHLLAAFDANAAQYNTIVIPWGAEHMPFMEASLRARGYTIRSQSTRRVAGYATIFNALFRRH